MIGRLSGILAEKKADRVLVDVGGVGYNVLVSQMTLPLFPAVGEKIALHIHTHVREDQLVLYGFLEPREQELFCHFISVAGIGPKSALNILSHVSTEELLQALHHGDAERLAKAPGVGKKTASRLVIELKDKVFSLSREGTTRREASTASLHYDDMCSALINLGYSRLDVEMALKKIDGFQALPLPDALRLALREIVRT